MTTREEFLATLTRSNVEAERSADTSSGRVTFYDADSGAIGEPTYNRSGKLNENFRQAYHDAPETDHNGKGAEIGAYDARDHFLQLLREHPDAHAQSTGSSDYYGRGNVTEFVTPDGTNINTEMIRSGLTIPLGQQTTDTRNAATAATFNTMTDAGDMLTGADAQTNAIARRVQAEASFALDSGLIPNPAFKDGFSPIHTNGIVSDAYNRGVHQTKAMLHAGVAAVADAVGADGLKQRELDAADASQTKAGAFYSRSNTWDDVHNFSDAGTYALEKTVENLPVIGLTAGAALATGGASLTAEGALAAAGARTAASVVSRIGAREGAMAALYGVNTGDTALQLRDEGVKDFGTPSLLVGVPKTMLDYASLASMSRGVKRAVSESFKGKGFDPVSAAHEFIKDVATESGTEGFQQIWDNGAVAATTGKPFNFNNVGESMIAGGTVGFAFGVGHATPGAVRSAIGHITSREPRQDIEAQLQAQRDGSKPATFVSQANADSYDAQVEAAGPDATVLRSPEGQLATSHPVSDAERTAYESGTPEERSAINQAHLGYSQDKSQIDLSNSSVVQVTTPEGAVIHEEVTDQPQAVASKLEQAKRPTDVVSVTTPHAAQARRFEAMGHELSVAVAKAHDQVQTLVEQGAPHEQVVEAAKEYEQAAGHLEQVMQLHEQATQDTLTPTATVTGESNGQPTRLADDARRNVPNAGTSGAGTIGRDGDNGTRSVDSGASQNAPVAGDRAKGPRVDFGRLAPEEQSHIVRRVASEPEFARVIKAYVKQGYSHTAALEFALADEKIAAEDIPDEYTPSADNTLFDESELPTTDVVVSPDDTDAAENIKNFANGAYYGSLMVAHQEAFTARYPTWELIPQHVTGNLYSLTPRKRFFASASAAEAEAQRLEPLYYGYMFKPVSHDGVYTLSRHKVNGALSTDAVSMTRSWVYQSLPKIKLNSRGTLNAISKATKRSKRVKTTSKMYADASADVALNKAKLLEFKQPDGSYIELHTPTLVEQGMRLLGEYGSYTTVPQFKFLALKQAISALATVGITYESRQGPGKDFFPQETIIGFTDKGAPVRISDVTEAHKKLTIAEKALDNAQLELYKLEGALNNVRSSAKNAGVHLSKQGGDKASWVQNYAGKLVAGSAPRRIKTNNLYQREADRLSELVAAQRLIVARLRADVSDLNGANPTGKDPYIADEIARSSDNTKERGIADGMGETERMTANANASVEKSVRTESKGFAGDASGFYKPENAALPTAVTTPVYGTAADLPSVDAEAVKYDQKGTREALRAIYRPALDRAYASVRSFFADVPNVKFFVSDGSSLGSYFYDNRAVMLARRLLTPDANPIGERQAVLVWTLAHELSHAKDHAAGMPSLESGLFHEGGAIHDEAVDLLSTTNETISWTLDYPFNSGFNDNDKARELFANLSALYITEPELMNEYLPQAYQYFDNGFRSGFQILSGPDTNSGTATERGEGNAQELVKTRIGEQPQKSQVNNQRPAHLKSIRVVPTSKELREKFRGLTPVRVNRWVQTLKDASSPFANLVLTGYTQLKAVHAATADRFKTYIAHKNQMGAYWLSVWHNQIGLDTKRTAAAFDELRAHGEDANITKDMVSADAWALRTFLDEIHKSMLKRYSPTIGKIPNYLPQPVDTRAMISDKEGFLSVLMRYSVDVNKSSTPMDRTTAENIFDSLLGNSTLDGLTIDEVAGAVGPGNKHRYQRVLRNPALIAALDSNGFLFSDKREAMEYYITQGVNRSAFERTFGGYRPVVAMLDQNGAINKSVLANKIRQADIGYLLNSGRLPHELLNDVISMGYARMVNNHVHWYSPVSKLHDARESLKSDATQLRKFDDLIHGMLGFFGDRIGAETKKWQSRIMAGESLLTLAFSTLSSQTDWAGPALRIMQDKGVAAAWRELLAGIRSFSNAKEADSFARAFGFIVPRQHQSAIRAMSGADHMSAGAQKTLDMLFHYNGQEWFTNMTRSFAASTGIHYFKTLAEAQDDVLQSYGIDYEIINRWVKAGEHAPTQEMENSDKAAFDDAMAVHTALHKFVNESIMRPDATQRPNWANDPRFALLWHLKSFFWAFWSTIMEPTFKSAFTQMKNGNHGEAAAQLAFTGLLLLPLAAVGWEIKQVIQYSLFGEDQPSDDMDGVQYTLQLISRADVFGPAQLAFDALGTDGADKAAARLAGPAADHLFTLLHAETDKKIYRSIPVLSQLYGAQRVISD